MFITIHTHTPHWISVCEACARYVTVYPESLSWAQKLFAKLSKENLSPQIVQILIKQSARSCQTTAMSGSRTLIYTRVYTCSFEKIRIDSGALREGGGRRYVGELVDGGCWAGGRRTRAHVTEIQASIAYVLLAITGLFYKSGIANIRAYFFYSVW